MLLYIASYVILISKTNPLTFLFIIIIIIIIIITFIIINIIIIIIIIIIINFNGNICDQPFFEQCSR